MATKPLDLTLEAFHHQYDGAKPAYEYWDGAVVRKSMPTVLHGIVQLVLMMFLKRAGWTTAPEVRLKVSREAEPVPDVIAIRGRFTEMYPTSAPQLCVEILSPSDTLSKAFEKAQRYITWGTQSVWIIDPEKRTAWTLAQESAAPKWISPDGNLEIGDTSIGLTALFEEVDRDLQPGAEI